MAETVCKIPGCDLMAQARGWCPKHYQRWRKSGDPNETERIVGNDSARDHLCCNRLCVRPDHLEPVTPKENILRSDRSLPGVNSRKTHCVNGHEFTEANTYLRPDRPGRRQCRACHATRVRTARGSG